MATTWLVLMTVLGTGPSPLPAPVPVPAPTSTPAPATSPAPVAASLARPALPSARTLFREAVALEPTGAVVKLGDEPDTVVDPAATFRIELGATVRDARLLLLDGADAVVPAAATREIGATTRLTLAPAEPLRPGSRYVLRLDGVAQRELHDASGAAFGPATLVLLAAGEPPPPEPKPARRKRGRR